MKMKQGQKIKFDTGTIKGTGKIVGKAMNELPIIGATWIIEPDKPIETYEYSHFVLNETQFEKI